MPEIGEYEMSKWRIWRALKTSHCQMNLNVMNVVDRQQVAIDKWKKYYCWLLFRINFTLLRIFLFLWYKNIKISFFNWRLENSLNIKCLKQHVARHVHKQNLAKTMDKPKNKWMNCTKKKTIWRNHDIDNNKWTSLTGNVSTFMDACEIWNK